MYNHVVITLDENDYIRVVNNPQFGLFIANEWKRLISPYTPRREGTLEDTAKISPFEIEYIQPYSAYVYYGDTFNFRKDNNPYATHHWDGAAVKAGQQEKLVKSAQKYINNYINKGEKQYGI